MAFPVRSRAHSSTLDIANYWITVKFEHFESWLQKCWRKEGLNGSSQLREITILSAKTNDRHRIRVRLWKHKRGVTFSIGTLDEQNPSAVGMGQNSVVSEIMRYLLSVYYISIFLPRGLHSRCSAQPIARKLIFLFICLYNCEYHTCTYILQLHELLGTAFCRFCLTEAMAMQQTGQDLMVGWQQWFRWSRPQLPRCTKTWKPGWKEKLSRKSYGIKSLTPLHKYMSMYTLCILYVYLGGGFKCFFNFTPIPGEMIQFDEHIFQMGWFNHQSATSFCCWKQPPGILWKKSIKSFRGLRARYTYILKPATHSS